MGRAKVQNIDAITRREAAATLGVSEERVRRYRRDGLLSELPGYPSFSRREVRAIVADPWLSGKEAANLLEISRSRMSQLAAADRVPFFEAESGRKYYRREQLLTVENARRARREGFRIG